MTEQESFQLTEDDFRQAVIQFGTYVDITEEDMLRLYEMAVKIGKERCTNSWIARDIMTREVISVKGDADVHEAGRLLIKNRISGMPVVDNENHVVGMLSSADLLALAGIPRGHVFNDVVMKYILHNPAPQHRTGKSVREIMNTSVITVSPETSVTKIAEILDKKAITRVPVVDRERRLAGIVSRADIIRIVCKDSPEKGGL